MHTIKAMPPRLTVPIAVSIVLLLLLLNHYSDASMPSSFSFGGSGKGGGIPNQVLFVYILNDPSADIKFQFSHYLSLFAAWHLWKPRTIYLATNADDASISRARSGKSGKWSKLLFQVPGVKVYPVSVPTHADNGIEIKYMEHRSDFVRVKAMYELGGVYIDFDVHPLRDIKVLRESGFNAIAGRQFEGQINSGTFMTKKGGKMIKLWMDGMHQAYNGGWTTHSNEVITKFGERLVSEPGEMLIMEREAFAPGSWNADDSHQLFQSHDDVGSSLYGIRQGDALPTHLEGFSDRWDKPDKFPGWARDWSRTYLLHAFSPTRFNGAGVVGFDHVSPRYVLERKSNFARAVYPVVKEMYDRGLVRIDDNHDD